MLISGLQKTTLVDYPGRVACTIFTGGCNFRCPYCQNSDLVLYPEETEPYSEEEIFDHLARRQGVLSGVCISGGEPTLQPDMKNFIRKIKDLGLAVKLDTNGSNPAVLKELITEGLLDYVAMDIKHSRAKYASVACSPSFNLDDIAESVDFLKEGHVDYEFRTTLVKEMHREADMTAIGMWLMGAKAYYLQPYRDSDTVICPGYHAHSREELDTFVKILSAFLPKVELRGDI